MSLALPLRSSPLAGVLLALAALGPSAFGLGELAVRLTASAAAGAALDEGFSLVGPAGAGGLLLRTRLSARPPLRCRTRATVVEPARCRSGAEAFSPRGTPP